MAISYVGGDAQSSANTNGGTNTITVTLPTIQANDFALLFLSKGNNDTLTTNPTSSGFTSLHTATNGTTNSTYVWYKKLVGNETTLTATWTNAAYNAMGVAVYRGVDASQPFNATYTGGTFTTNDATPDFSAITTVSANTQIVYIANAVKNTSTSAAVTWTAPSGTTNTVTAGSTRNNSLNASVFQSSKAQAAVATVAATTASVDLNVDYWAYTIALQETQTLSVTGIASAEAHGTTTLSTGPVTLVPTAISSAETVPSPLANTTTTLTASGIATAQAFGSATLSAPARLNVSGISSAEAVSTPNLQLGYPQSLTVAGIASAQALGTPTVQYLNVMYAAGIASAGAFGTPTLSPQATTLTATAIASAGAVPTPVLRTSITLTAVGIDDSAIGIVGTPTIIPGPATLVVPAIASAETIGTTTMFQVEETWGVLQIT